MLPHHDLDEAVAARRRRANRAAARRLPSGRMPIRSPASKRAKPRPGQPLPERGARQGEAQDRGRGLHLGAVVAARDERQRLGRRAERAGATAPARSPAPAPSARPQRAKSCGDWRSTVSRGRSSGQPFASAAAATAFGEGAVGREAAVAEAEHGERRVGRAVEPRQPVEEALGRGGRRAVAIGRGQHDDPLRPGRSGPERRPTSGPTWTLCPASVSAACSVAAKPQVLPPSLPTSRIVSARPARLVAPDARPPAPPGEPEQHARCRPSRARRAP